MKGCLKTFIWIGSLFFASFIGFIMLVAIYGEPSTSSAATSAPVLTASEIQTQATAVTYDQLMRYADQWQDKPVTFTGKVVQVGDGWNGGWIRVIIDNEDYSSDAVYVEYDHNDRILEDDSVTVYGVGDGRIDYETVMGASTSAPRITGSAVTVNQ